jgi:ribose 5-phosphate isomerase A
VAAARLIQDGMMAGMGTGSTIAFLIEELARRMREEGIKFTAVPTSFQSRILCLNLGIPVRDMQDTASLDLAIDGADEVDPDLNLIKGGGASHTREKIVAAMAKEFVVVVDESKLVRPAGQHLRRSRRGVALGAQLRRTRHPRSGRRSILRMAVRKDGPVVTDNGELVFDVRFAPRRICARSTSPCTHPGMIETGLFFDMAESSRRLRQPRQPDPQDVDPGAVATKTTSSCGRAPVQAGVDLRPQAAHHQTFDFALDFGALAIVFVDEPNAHAWLVRAVGALSHSRFPFVKNPAHIAAQRPAARAAWGS